MTYHKVCVRCGVEFGARHFNARYCPACKVLVRKESSTKCNADRKLWTSRANAVAGRVDFNGGRGRRAQA